MHSISNHYALYEKLLNQGIAREIARICLPVALYTEMYWQIDLHNLFHFLHLRLHTHAQYEIRVYAQEIMSIIQDICPIACEAFNDYLLHKTEFYSSEYPALKYLWNSKVDDNDTTNVDILDPNDIEKNLTTIVEHTQSFE